MKNFIFFLIIISFLNCARQVVKNQKEGESLLENIYKWQDKVKRKMGTGEMIVSESNNRFSSYFSFEYDVESKTLKGELLGSFGMVIGSFYFSSDSISMKDKENREVKEEIFSLLEENPELSLPRFLMWDIPISSNPEVIPLEKGWILAEGDLEVFVSQDLKPIKVVLNKNGKISINYSDFLTEKGILSPGKVEAKTENKNLLIEFRKIQIE
ncbi:MAG: hypothetical protein ABIN61_02475 [candidate division WOR-3 bacterium]